MVVGSCALRGVRAWMMRPWLHWGFAQRAWASLAGATRRGTGECSHTTVDAARGTESQWTTHPLLRIWVPMDLV
ncbi:hypothetical protein IQ07DRAFT_348949 [Pyrenochaeta sp. DS3sAY3a]|nr:hypothetical protein IQ07DRAFT_348949 [Pyrenochaeta sp. DS3sAY3a]